MYCPWLWDKQLTNWTKTWFNVQLWELWKTFLVLWVFLPWNWAFRERERERGWPFWDLLSTLTALLQEVTVFHISHSFPLYWTRKDSSGEGGGCRDSGVPQILSPFLNPPCRLQTCGSYRAIERDHFGQLWSCRLKESYGEIIPFDQLPHAGYSTVAMG